jgi:ABC-2 type transport system permease protein
MFKAVKHIIRKEFIQTFRDKRMIIPLFIAPVIQLILFGFAVTTDIKNISVTVLDLDRTSESRTLISSIEASPSFDLDYHVDSYDSIDDLIQRGKIQAAIVIPVEFEKDLKRNKQAQVQLIADGTDANTATIIMGYIGQLIAMHSESILAEFRQLGVGGIMIPEPRIWYNPELKSSVYMVPGVICLVLLLTTLIFTSMAITKEREMGTIEQLIVSPIKPWQLMVGKTIPFCLIGIVDVALVILAGKLIFSLPIQGSLVFLFFVALVFIVTSLSLGLLVSTVSRTQQQAMMTSFFIIMPAMMLSGIFSPLDSMPRLIQHITYLNPLRYFSTALRGILLKGNDLAILWPEILALFLFGVSFIIISSLRFRKYLE